MIRLRRFGVFALVLACAPSPAWGQSLLAREGLGYVVDPVDARARGLGGAAVGLSGINLSLVNPAMSALTPAAALLVGFQFDATEAEMAGGTVEGQTPRFPVIHAALPLGQRWGISIGYGGFLDQSWAVESEDTVIGLRSQPVIERDRLASRGGVGRLRLGLARRLGERIAVGIGADVYTGSARDSVSRFFYRTRNPDTLETTLLPFSSLSTQNYSGIGFAAGVRWNPSEALGLEAALSHGGQLRARPADGEQGEERSYGLPLSASVGASGRVAQRTSLVAAGQWVGWDRTGSDLAVTGGAQNVWSLRGGVEHELVGANDRVFPVRLGGRYQTLPFASTGGDFAIERAVSAGLGARLGGGAAWLDLAVERGARNADSPSFSENFWRVSTSLMVLGR